MAKATIPFVGPWGCGKTVLLTVLTQCFQHPKEDGSQMRPINQAAVDFCVQKWGYLQRGEWPPPTPAAEHPPIYRWELCRGAKTHEITTSDIAGEAWRAFITKSVDDHAQDSVRSAWQDIRKKLEKLPSKLSQDVIDRHVTSMENLLKGASAVYLLLDLSQIVDKEPGYELAMYLPLALAQHMRNIGRKHVPIKLVLTKVDKYKYMYEEKGSWQKVLEEHIPWIPTFETILPVSAVANTKKGRPEPGFRSEGLDKLFEDIWGETGGGRKRELLQSLKRFCIIDVPILVALYLIYLFIYVVSPWVWPCHIFFWFCTVTYCAVKTILYLNKKR